MLLIPAVLAQHFLTHRLASLQFEFAHAYDM